MDTKYEYTCLEEKLNSSLMTIGKNVPRPYRIVTTAIWTAPWVQLLIYLATALMSDLMQ